MPVQLETGGKFNPIKQFQQVTGRVEGQLSKLGLTTRDVSVLMGAGLAGGVAFAARELVRFGAAAVEASSALREQQSASQAIFDLSHDLVGAFSEQAAAIGLSERAALQATTTFGGFFQNLGFGEEESAKLAVGFTSLAADLASFFNIDTETATQRLISGLRGEQEAVERLNVNINEKLVLDRAMKDSEVETADAVTLGEKARARANIILEQTVVAQGDVLRTSESLANRQRELNAEWENSKAALGDALLPVVNTVTQALTDQLNSLRALDDGFKRTGDSVTLFGIGYRNVIDGEDTNVIQKLKDLWGGWSDEADDAADTSDELASAQETLATAELKVADATEASTEALENVTKARKRLARALEDQTRNVERAEDRLARAIEDSELRVDAAERNLAEAFEDRTERIADAERDLEQTRIQGARSVRDARERLEDFDREANEREVDAERNLINLRKERTRAILNANVALSAAKRAGDAEAINAARLALKDAQNKDTINEAERELAQERKDRKLERERLERELSETIVDVRRQEADAQRELAQTIEDTNERIEDAERSLADARRDGARQVEDAQRALNDAIREGKERVDDARDSLEEYEGKAIAAAKATKRLKNEMKDLDKIAMKLAEDFFDPELSGAFAELMGRQHGGPVVGGRPYLIGEAGPELMVPGRSGSVVSNDQLIAVLEKMAANNGGSSQPGIGQMVVQVPHQDPRVLANELAYRLLRGVVR